MGANAQGAGHNGRPFMPFFVLVCIAVKCSGNLARGIGNAKIGRKFLFLKERGQYVFKKDVPSVNSNN